MRRKIPYRVCRCMPDGVVTHLEARLLREIVNREIHPIRCAESCKVKYKRGMRIGDLCAETGHFGWARKVWRFTAMLIESKDYDDWRYVWFDNNRVRLCDVISETEYELLERRCADLWGKLGFKEYAWWNERTERLTSNNFGTQLWHQLLLPVCRKVRWLLRRTHWRMGGYAGAIPSRAGNGKNIQRRARRLLSTHG